MKNKTTLTLTPQEWWSFAPWDYDMDIAPKDGTHIAIKSDDSLFDIGYWSGYRWDNTHDFFIDNPIAWLPLPENK